jgi:pyruvate kinase
MCRCFFLLEKIQDSNITSCGGGVGGALTRCPFLDCCKVGGTVLLDDGLLELTVVSVDQTVACVANNAAPIKARKGVNLPGCVIQLVRKSAWNSRPC